MSCVADTLELRYADTDDLNSRSLSSSLRSIVVARSVTALWRSSRACSWGVWGAEGAACAFTFIRPRPFASSLAGDGREAVTVGGSEARGGGRAANASPGVGAVSCPPNALVVADCEF